MKMSHYIIVSWKACPNPSLPTTPLKPPRVNKIKNPKTKSKGVRNFKYDRKE